MVESTFEKRCLDIAAPTELSFISATLFSVLILTNIPGNILIILALLWDPNKNLRTPFNWLVVNLAIADLIIGIIAQPILVTGLIKEGLRKHGIPGEWVASHMTYFISCTASVLSLISLTVERCLAVREPIAYRKKVTKKRVVITIVLIWLISLSLPNFYLYVGFTTYAFIFANTSLTFAVLIISVTYALMRRELHKITQPSNRNLDASSIPNRINVTSKTHSVDATSQNVQSTSAEVINMEQSSKMNTNLNSSNAVVTSRRLLEEKVTKIFLIVLIALMCCYGPSTILMYLVNFCDDCSCITLHWFRDIHVLLIYINSSINFFCYALRSLTFRSAFCKLLRLDRRRPPHRSFNLTSSQNTPAKEKGDTAPRAHCS